MADPRPTAETTAGGLPVCPYARCAGTVEVEAEGTWGDRRAVYGRCLVCRRTVEVVEGVEQLDMDVLLGVPYGAPSADG